MPETISIIEAQANHFPRGIKKAAGDRNTGKSKLNEGLSK